MDVSKEVLQFLDQQEKSAPSSLKIYFEQFKDLYSRKLWHQLTLAVETFAAEKDATPLLIPLYQNFIADWSGKMNQLLLVKYMSLASRQLGSPTEALEFLEKQRNKIKDAESARDAYVFTTVEVAHYNLQIQNKQDECKKLLDEAEKLLESLTTTDVSTNAIFYRVSADYFKVKMQYPQYYHNALLFLSSVQLSNISEREQQERAYELAISALLGDGLYNFGELLQHPILDALQGTSFNWLRDLLFCYNTGNLDGFDKIVKTSEFLKEKLLVNSLESLRQKLCLMTLMESVFKRSKESRGAVTFDDISKETRVSSNEVEHLVMKALSLGLVKGYIDEVDKVVQFTWVQPRVLGKDQISSIAERLGDWAEKVFTLNNKAASA